MSEQLIPPLDRVGANLATAFDRAEAAPTKRVPRRKLLLATGFAAVVLLAAVPAYVTLGGHRVASLSTAEAIDQVATAAESNPLPFAREDQFQYTRSRGTFVWSFGGSYNPVTKETIPPYSALVTSERKAWVSVQRRGAMDERQIAVKWVTPRDRRLARKHGGRAASGGRPPMTAGLAPDGQYYFLGKSISRSQLEKAPTDPKVIYGRALKSLNGAGQGSADGVWQALSEPLYEFSYPAGVRAGMVRALGLIPGVKTLGIQRDPLGREGIAISRVHAGVRDTLLFDRTNSAVLYQHSTVVRKAKDAMSWPVGTTVADYLAYEQRVVDALPSSVLKKLPPERRTKGTGVRSNVGN
ncbi:MAG: hypothetical protein ACSLFF_08415 [Solirubrobacterales bacterium]